VGFRTNEKNQMRITDRLNNLTERERRILEKSWAKYFGDVIFPMINEEKFAALYCTDNGRPNTPINVVIGSIIIKELQRRTDEELVDDVILDIRYQYALPLTSHEEIPYSDRTPSRFRERLYWHELETGEDLLKEEIERLSGAIAKLMKISGNVKRMDSLMVSSSCKTMGRLELIYTCVSNLVKELVKSGESHLLPEQLLKYADESNKNAVCYRMEKDEVLPRLEAVTADALLVYETAASLVGGFEDFQRLERMLGDQTKNGKLKPAKEISPRSLQNPSDEDATFRRKGGVGHQGYSANIVEDCGETGSIITHYDFDVNLHSDADFCNETIEKLGVQEEPVVLIADGANASDENFKAAAKNNIELVTTALSGNLPPEIVLEFVISENEITACPAGHTPEKSTWNAEKETMKADFDREACAGCPHKDECPVKIYKKKAVVTLSIKTINRAKHAQKLSTEKYKEYARKRNGVEGMPSVLRRRYAIDNMPVRGLVRQKMLFSFKIGAINVKRAIVYAFLLAFLSIFTRCKNLQLLIFHKLYFHCSGWRYSCFLKVVLT